MHTIAIKRIRQYLGWAAIAALFLGIAAPTAGAKPPSKIDRQLMVFEKVLNSMLVDSPNFLVSNREPASGHYAQGRGAVFLFRTSLVSSSDHGWGVWERLWNDDDKQNKKRDKAIKRQAREYEEGKEELIETILFFGEVLTSLTDNEELEVKARLRKTAYFKENDLDWLIMKVGMADLRAYYDGRLSEEQMIQRIQVEEK